ncbi:MAG: phenylalanine--tRNA ligase subunit beta, partial [Calditrichaeota bacterium]
MKISYNWLKELVNIDWSPEELGDKLTLCGTACEYIEPTDEFMDKVVVGEINAINKIEGADKIRLATVDLGDRKLDVVCGAPNIEVGQKVPVATLGAKLSGGIEI